MAKAKKDGIQDRLAKYQLIQLNVVGRKTGRTVSIPVWFVSEDQKLYLLPVHGSDTQWYLNILKNPSIRVDARGEEGEFRTTALKQPKSVESVISKFREKYGAGEVKKYYSKFDVAVLAEPV